MSDNEFSVFVATSFPVANTGIVDLVLIRPGHANVKIAVKNSAVVTLGNYEIQANSIAIANITSTATGFSVAPSTSTVPGASFAVYVNLSN